MSIWTLAAVQLVRVTSPHGRKALDTHKVHSSYHATTLCLLACMNLFVRIIMLWLQSCCMVHGTPYISMSPCRHMHVGAWSIDASKEAALTHSPSPMIVFMPQHIRGLPLYLNLNIGRQDHMQT